MDKPWKLQVYNSFSKKHKTHNFHHVDRFGRKVLELSNGLNEVFAGPTGKQLIKISRGDDVLVNVPDKTICITSSGHPDRMSFRYQYESKLA